MAGTSRGSADSGEMTTIRISLRLAALRRPDDEDAVPSGKRSRLPGAPGNDRAVDRGGDALPSGEPELAHERGNRRSACERVRPVVDVDLERGCGRAHFAAPT